MIQFYHIILNITTYLATVILNRSMNFEFYYFMFLWRKINFSKYRCKKCGRKTFMEGYKFNRALSEFAF